EKKKVFPFQNDITGRQPYINKRQNLFSHRILPNNTFHFHRAAAISHHSYSSSIIHSAFLLPRPSCAAWCASAGGGVRILHSPSIYARRMTSRSRAMRIEDSSRFSLDPGISSQRTATSVTGIPRRCATCSSSTSKHHLLICCVGNSCCKPFNKT